jgi:hypothetical protein
VLSLSIYIIYIIPWVGVVALVAGRRGLSGLALAGGVEAMGPWLRRAWASLMLYILSIILYVYVPWVVALGAGRRGLSGLALAGGVEAMGPWLRSAWASLML